MFNPDYENLPSFKSFVARQPADMHYQYTDSTNCACAQYLKSENRYNQDWLSNPQIAVLNKIAQGSNDKFIADDWTFGKLLDRINAKEKELA